jgi:hypothetical protein
MYHLSIGEVGAVSTSKRENESRSFQIYEDLAMLLFNEAKQLYGFDDDLDVSLKGNVFAIDAATIDFPKALW